jgi:exosome complex RNA-binding protein Rrp4
MPKPAIASDLIVVLPGDNVTKHIDFSAKESSNDVGKPPKLGTGLRFDSTTRQVYATCPGRLERHRNKQVYFVEPNKIRRYRPALEDRVVGIVLGRAGPDGVGGDLYRLEIGASHTALLSNMQFEGASKRNKPAFLPGVEHSPQSVDVVRLGLKVLQ